MPGVRTIHPHPDYLLDMNLKLPWTHSRIIWKGDRDTVSRIFTRSPGIHSSLSPCSRVEQTSTSDPTFPALFATLCNPELPT